MVNWKTTTFGALGQLFDGPHATPTRREHGPYFLNISSLKSGRLDLSESDHVSREDFATWTRRATPQKDDLLFSYETRLGEAALMPEGLEACLGRRMALLRPDTRVVDPRYLLYYFLSPAFQDIIAKHTIHGATVTRIGLATMPSWEITLPPLREQRAIGEVLGALDDKIAANDRVDALAAELGKSLFRRDLDALLVDRIPLGELAAKRVISLSDGYRTKRTEHAPHGFRILRAGDVEGGRLSLTGPDFVSAQFERQIGQKAVRAGDIVLTTKGSVGRVAVVPWGIEHAVYSPQLCYFRVVDAAELHPGFLAAWFMSDDLQRQAESRMFKTDMAPYINLQDIRSMEVPYPAADVRAAIGQRQDAFQQHIHVRQSESRALAAMRDELLLMLLTGKVQVPDAGKAMEGVA